MNVTDFISAKTVIVLPSHSRPKVHLAINNGEIAKRAFMLYNPFSKKARFLKTVARFLCVYCNTLVRFVIPRKWTPKSEFLLFLDDKLNTDLISSLYIATANHKVVLQWQNNLEISGYLKYPTSEMGKLRLLQEQKAIGILSKLKVIPDLILRETYKNTPFLVLKNLSGSIGPVEEEEYLSLLDNLRKETVYLLKDHPRIIGLKQKIEESGLLELNPLLNEMVKSSKIEYAEVFEHGDFAAWNLIRTDSGLIPFDFEYFVEQGIEYFDQIKFVFQDAHLINGKIGKMLIREVKDKTNIEEFNIVFSLFLMKEIINKNTYGVDYEFEYELLKSISLEKA